MTDALRPCGFCGKVDYYARDVRCGADNKLTVTDAICATCHPPLEKLKDEYNARHPTA